MNLTLDIGNTQAKLAVFDDKLLEVKSFDSKYIYCLLYTSDAADE